GPRQLVVAFGAPAFDRDRHPVAGLDRFAGALEIRQGDDAFGLEADIQVHRFAGDGDYGALQSSFPLFDSMGMGLLVLGKDVAERLGRLVGRLGSGTGSPILIQGAWVRHETLLTYCGIIPTRIPRVPAPPLLRHLRLIRPQDFVWLLLFAVLAVTNAEGGVFE